MDYQLKKIVLTGGPCAGKTTALVKVIDHFSSLGFKVFTIPEVPTIFAQAGMDYLTSNHEFFYQGESRHTAGTTRTRRQVHADCQNSEGADGHRL
jgi:6-phosphofructokinase